MKKIFIIVFLVLIALFIIINIKKTDSPQLNIKKNVKTQKQLNLDNIDFGKYPVPVEAGKIQKPTVSKHLQKISVNTPNIPKINTLKINNDINNINNKIASQTVGDKIPNWVYENTISSDRYSDLILSNSNKIFFSYADCPIGKSRKAMVKNAILRANVQNKFSDYSELVAVGSSYMATCNKTYKDGRCQYNPAEVNEGTCKCAPHYFLDNCMNNFCIINPKQKRIVIVSPNEDALAEKLETLNNNW